MLPPRDDSDVVKRLQKLHPYATVAECKRFFACVKYNEEAASKRLGEFFKWRSDCGLKAIADASGHNDDKHARVYNPEFIKKDEEDWNACARIAVNRYEVVCHWKWCNFITDHMFLRRTV